MAGYCILCNNLFKREMYFDGKKLEGCGCYKKKFDVENLEGFFSLDKVTKQTKEIKDVQDKCDSWDDRLKPKSNS